MPGKKMADDGLRGPGSPSDRVVWSEMESEVQKLVDKMRQTPPFERRQALRKLIEKARTSDDIAIVRRVVERCNLLVELREIQQDMAKPSPRRARK